MFTLKGSGSEGSGPGLVRVSGSFTTLANGTVTLTRPSKGDFTVTRLATGVYQFTYQQATLSVVSAGCQLGAATADSGVAFDVNPPGFCIISADYMVANVANTQYLTDTSNKNLIILCFTAPTSGSLTDVYSLGNNNSVAKYRLSFDITFATSTMNQ